MKNFINLYIFDKCPDCAVEDGERHVSGCDQEICPICKWQSISCGCFFEWVKKTHDLDSDDEPYYSQGFPAEIEDEYFEGYLMGKHLKFNSCEEIKARIETLRFCKNRSSLGSVRKDDS